METGIQMFPGETRHDATDGENAHPGSLRRPTDHGGGLEEPNQLRRPGCSRTACPVAAQLHGCAGRAYGEPSKSELVSIVYVKDGRPQRIKARTVVMAGGDG